MTPETGEICAGKNNMDWQKIATCYQGDEGKMLVTVLLSSYHNP